MAAALKVVGDGGARSPERESLAAAIAEAAEYRATADATRAGVARARAMIADATARLDAANADAAKAREAHAERAITAASTGAPMVPDGSLRDARQRAGDATDDLEAAQAALAAVEASLEDEEYRERKSIERVGEAADLVLQAVPIEGMLEEAARVQREVIEKRTVLLMLTAQYRQWKSDGSHQRLYASNDELLVARISKFLGVGESLLPSTGNSPIYGESPAAQQWLQAREALLTDPDAVLPA